MHDGIEVDPAPALVTFFLSPFPFALSVLKYFPSLRALHVKRSGIDVRLSSADSSALAAHSTLPARTKPLGQPIRQLVKGRSLAYIDVRLLEYPPPAVALRPVPCLLRFALISSFLPPFRQPFAAACPLELERGSGPRSCPSSPSKPPHTPPPLPPSLCLLYVVVLSDPY